MNEQTPLNEISLAGFRNHFSDAPCIGVDDGFFIIDLSFQRGHKFLSHPCRLDGVMVLYCISGHIRLNVNMDEYDLQKHMLFLNLPGNLIRVNEVVDDVNEGLHYLCMAMSRDFINGLLPDANRNFTQNTLLHANPCICISEQEKLLLADHERLISAVLKSDFRYKYESLKSVIASVFYTLAGIWAAHLGDENASANRSACRNKAMFEQFISLVSEYHTQYRNVGFYAEKLGLTPKYLSRLIKEASGRSAPDWIDAYVILEAKNLLKYSSIAIKEIVFRLNFPNPSVFYKFFKGRTGLTPSEYRRS